MAPSTEHNRTPGRPTRPSGEQALGAAPRLRSGQKVNTKLKKRPLGGRAGAPGEGPRRLPGSPRRGAVSRQVRAGRGTTKTGRRAAGGRAGGRAAGAGLYGGGSVGPGCPALALGRRPLLWGLLQGTDPHAAHLLRPGLAVAHQLPLSLHRGFHDAQRPSAGSH